MQETTYCFFGHRNIIQTEHLKEQVYAAIEKLIVDKNVDTFLFGSKSQFNSMCHALVTELKANYPHIKRVYVRAEFPQIDNSYKEYLLEMYEDTYYPEKLFGAGKAVYVERNREMIDNSSFCIVYCQACHSSNSRKSGTALALRYAIQKNKNILLYS